MFSFIVPCIGQDGPKTSPSYFSNASLGFGMIYGGLGGNAELGIRHLSAFGSFGYAPKSYGAPIPIQASYNYLLGFRYHFNVGSEMIFPHAGLGFGWITNYYDQRIGLMKYDQNVYGLSLHTGVQIYSEEGFVFNFDIAMSSSAVIANPNTHPYFYVFYIRPCVGVGYDLARVFNKENGQTIKNRKINPFD